MTTRYDYNYLIQFCEENDLTLKKDYKNQKITRNSIIIADCITQDCQDTFEKTLNTLIKHKNFNCKTHSKIVTQQRFKKTNMEKYGAEYPIQNENIKQKIKETNMEKYGFENASQNEEIKQKIKDTNMEKYGVGCLLQNEEVKQKIKETNVGRYGFENPFQSEEIKQKIKETNTEKYGYSCSLQNEEIKTKSKNTCLERYGHEYSLQNEEVKAKCKETCIKHHGVEHPLQNKEISEKASKNAYKSKEYEFPSGKIEKVQGYEPFALNDLLNIENIDEKKIIVCRSQVPEIWWNGEDNKKHRYFVDIFIPEQKRCIEVKSTWTFESRKDITFRKQNAVKKEGYSCEIWIYSEKGEKINCLK